MDTKLKVRRHFGFKILAFLLSLAGLLTIAVGIANMRQIMAFIDMDEYVSNVFFGERYELCEAITNINFRADGDGKISVAGVEKNQKYIDSCLQKGYRFTVYDDDSNVIPVYGSYNGDFETFSNSNKRVYNNYGMNYNNTEIGISLAVTNDAYNAALDASQPIADRGRILFYAMIAGLLLFIGGMIWIGVFAGKVPNEDGVKLRFFHRIYGDLFLICFIGAQIGLGAAYYAPWSNIAGYSGDVTLNMEAVWAITVIVAVLMTFILAWFVANLSVRVKRHELFKYTAFYRFFAWIFRGLVRLGRWIVHPFKLAVNGNIKSKIIACGVGVFVILCFFSFLAYAAASSYNTGILFIYIMIGVPIITVGFVAVALKFFAEFSAIRNGAREIRNGNPTYKIPPCKNGEFNQIAEDINNIGDGLERAVKDALVSERMKTELITNVSHDLKTPLTSIVSYVDLLEKVEIPPEAQDYVAVIKSKAGRLTAIISDLFDLSKSSSGSIDLLVERLDLSKLVQQTLADMDDKIVASGFAIKQDLPEGEVLINSDGKRLYRAFQNVIDNALKYSLTGTRIFITMQVEGGRASVKIQNTAGYEMDFSESEILERFSRGDSSRGTEGTGLGLSIAESFTKICGGGFKIKIDGDQFKVYLDFNVVG